MPLTSSFWLDETGTVFVVHHGAAHASLLAAPQVPASIYYLLPALAEKVAGPSEVSYRFFSVLAMGCALIAIARLASRLIGPHAAWVVVFACLTSRNFNFQAADARPYALGTLILSVAILCLVRWMDSARWSDGLLFAFCASALWWVQLVFWPFYLIFPVYAIVQKKRPQAMQMAVVTGIIIAACIPPLIQALALLKTASNHVVVPAPTFRDLISELKLPIVIAATALALLLTRVGRDGIPRAGWQPAHSAVALILAWWLIDPLTLYAFSNLTQTSLFVPRYMYPAIPGTALAACLFIPPKFSKPIALTLGCATLLFAGHLNQLAMPHQASDWRTAAQHLRTWSDADTETVAIICPSPFIEARPPVWTPNYQLPGFLYSQLEAYPITGRIYPFPFESSPEANAWAHQLTTDNLARTRRFAIYGEAPMVTYWTKWFASQPELARWDNTVIGLYGDVELIAFTNPNTQMAARHP